jgi:predicted DsbA family dithiol-disulfide isomerase
MLKKKIEISYYSDVLCVWAYVAQIRLETLKETFSDKIEVTPFHVTLFGDTATRIGEGWADRGGYAGFNQHVIEIGKQFPHVAINRDIWKICRPKTSGNAHLFLKAIQLLDSNSETKENKELLKLMEWQVRLAFFRDARDISDMAVLFDIAQQNGINRAAIEAQLNDGSAMSLFTSEMEMKDKHKLEGSPTYVLNNNRQKLFGNVGYKIMKANVQELLSEGGGKQASWC